MPSLVQPLTTATDGFLLDLSTGNRIYSTKALKAVILQDRSATVIYNTTASLKEINSTSIISKLTTNINSTILEAKICQ